MVARLNGIIRSDEIKRHTNKFIGIGVGISIGSVILAMVFVSYQLTSGVSINGLIQAQLNSAALWVLDVVPFIFALWGYFFVEQLVREVEGVIDERTQEFTNRSGDLESKLQFKAFHDSLTGLPNYQLLLQRTTQAVQKINNGDELAVIVIRVNRFKDINYKLGSFGANSLLVQFSEKLKSILLEPCMLQPYMGMNMIARLQGSEFAILIPRLRAEHDFEGILQKILDLTQFDFMLDGKGVKISTTIGASLCPIHGESEEILLRHASISLQWAEKEGEPYAIYNANMDHGFKTSHVIIDKLNEAITRCAYKLLYLPRYELATNKLVSAEAVIQFDDPHYGLMSTDKLLTLLEGSDVLKAFNRDLLKYAIEQLGAWKKDKKLVCITVRLMDLNDLDMPQFIADSLADNRVSSEWLQVELTEKICLSDQDNSMKILNKLSALGVRVAIGDFCSGFSSFVYLTNFPISEIKIDKSFIMNMANDEKKLKVVKVIINLADTLNLSVFADGIEDEETVENLIKIGCKYGQGSYLSKPVNEDEINNI